MSKEDLRWKKFTALNGQAEICLVDWMGEDRDIAQAARTSYGKDVGNIDEIPDKAFVELCEDNSIPYEKIGEGLHGLTNSCDEGLVWQLFKELTQKGDETLIRYLMRHRHSTPFEMVEVKLRVKVPMDLWRQWIRHRTASVNEYSTRYTEAIDEMATTPPDKWRTQASSNKQGSGGVLSEWPEGWSIERSEFDWCIIGSKTTPRIYLPLDKFPASPTPGEVLSYWESKLQRGMKKDYDIRRELNVANEQARKDLPLSNMTVAYWKCNLHNLFHFLGLRMDSHAQLEIRECATIIGEEIVAKLFPVSWAAFKDYRLNAMVLTGPEVELCRLSQGSCTYEAIESLFPNARERKEAVDKLTTLGLLK